jgi:hypothetical protein
MLHQIRFELQFRKNGTDGAKRASTIKCSLVVAQLGERISSLGPILADKNALRFNLFIIITGCLSQSV